VQDFVSIDVETANADMASLCQIGIASYVNGQLADEWSSLVNPEDDFDWINVSIHGIDEDTVASAPTYPDVYQCVVERLQGNIVVSHTHFDRLAINRVQAKYGTPDIKANWLDSARIARRTWSECAWSGYGLKSVCEIIGYQFKHHDALEDAKAAGQIVLEASRVAGLTPEQWLTRVKQPIDLSAASGASASVKREGDPSGAFYGETMVFTGSLQMRRAEAATNAAQLGFNVGQGVTKKTTVLVVGDQDVTRLAGHERSSKHRKALELIEKGADIRILKESDFSALVSTLQA